MRIEFAPGAMFFLRSLRTEGAPLWQAIEDLRTNPRPADAIDVSARPGRLQRHVRIGDRGYWLVWEAWQDRGETVVTVAIIEQN